MSPAITRPVIVVGTDEHRVNDEACSALSAIASDHGLHQSSDGKLLEVLADSHAARRVPIAKLRHLLSVAADFRRVVSGKLVSVHVPAWCVRAVYARGEWDVPAFRFGCIVRAPLSNVRRLRSAAGRGGAA